MQKICKKKNVKVQNGQCFSGPPFSFTPICEVLTTLRCERWLDGGHSWVLTNCQHFSLVEIAILLSRLGDRPTATILHTQFRFVDFCLGF